LDVSIIEDSDEALDFCVGMLGACTDNDDKDTEEEADEALVCEIDSDEEDADCVDTCSAGGEQPLKAALRRTPTIPTCLICIALL
jgi:hypothetical protein